MKIAGIGVVRNEIDIIDFCIDHHLNQGIDELYISDNGSTDGTLEYLYDLESKNKNIHIDYTPEGRFQANVTNRLAQVAMDRDNCEWLVPFDADEMVCSTKGLSNDLKNVHHSAVMLKTTNFVQQKDHDPDHGYLTATWVVKNPQDAGMDGLINGTQIMSQCRSGHKWILRAINNPTFSEGAHQYQGAGPDLLESDDFWIWHVPQRSFLALNGKADSGQRMRDCGYPLGAGFHAQRWNMLRENGKLQEEWDRNLVVDGKLIGGTGEEVELIYHDGPAKLYSEYLKRKDLVSDQ